MNYSDPKRFFLVLFILTCVCFEGFSQGGFTLKGVITSTNNEAIDGATLFLKDGISGQVLKQGLSNADGTFLFILNAGNYVMAISYLGKLSYQSDLLKLSGNTDLGLIKIEKSAQNLNEVVIQSISNKPLIKVEPMRHWS